MARVNHSCYVCGEDKAEVRPVHLEDYCVRCWPEEYICQQCCLACDWWEIDNHCSPWKEVKSGYIRNTG